MTQYPAPSVGLGITVRRLVSLSVAGVATLRFRCPDQHLMNEEM